MSCSDGRFVGPMRRAVWSCCLVIAAAASFAVGAEPPTPKRLTTDGRLKADLTFVSADEIVYTAQDSDITLSLYRLDLKSGQSTRVNPDAKSSEFEAAFARDGRRLCFVQSRGNLSLKLVIRNLLDGTEAQFDPGGGFAGMHSPAFSPDGSRIVFSKPDAGGQQIISIDAQGGDKKILGGGPGVSNWPSYAPDGSSMVFASSRDGDFDLYRMKPDGSEVRRIAASPGRDVRPRWAPDGSRIVFTSSRDGNEELYLCDPDGASLSRLTDEPDRDDYAAWRPDGAAVAFASWRDGQCDLYLLDLPRAAGK